MSQNKEEVENITKQLLDLKRDDLTTEEAIVNNEISFVYKNSSYKLVLPTFADKNKAEELKLQKKLELLQKPNYLPRKKLIEVYKEKGIDLSDYDKKVETLMQEQKKKQLQLAALSDDKKEQIDILISEIDNLKYQIIMTLVEKKKLLALSIEDLAFQHYVLALIVQCAYVRIDETEDSDKKYYRVYRDVQHLLDGDEYLANRFAAAASKMFDIEAE